MSCEAKLNFHLWCDVWPLDLKRFEMGEIVKVQISVS